MNTLISRLLPIALLPATLLLWGCASTTTVPSSLAAADPDYASLGNVRNTRLELARVSPEADLSGYRRIAFRTGEFQYRDVPPLASGIAQPSTRREFPLRDRDRAELEKVMNEIFREELARSSRYTLVEPDAGGSDLLVLEARLYDVISRVPPEPPTRGETYVDTVGEATLVLELIDGASGRVLARAADRRTAEPAGRGRGNFGALRASPVTAWQEVRRVVRRWAVNTRERVEAL